ncbi:PAS domain-containing protein [Nannocystis pusilla]|uniref:PAS domain-containing protein n=1 Tax=Nannocystis pusilla TaxID=889268 RepID=UPI003B7C1994
MHESEGQAGAPCDLAALIDSLPGMVYRCRADRVWTLDYVSAGALELTGYRPDELLASERRAYADLIIAMDRRAVEAAVETAVAAGQSFTIEYRIRDRAGRLKHVWERGRLLRGEGTAAVLEGFITDISRCAAPSMTCASGSRSSSCSSRSRRSPATRSRSTRRCGRSPTGSRAATATRPRSRRGSSSATASTPRRASRPTRAASRRRSASADGSPA